MLTGELRVPPGNRRYGLRGQGTIKVRVGTSDPDLAERHMRVVNGILSAFSRVPLPGSVCCGDLSPGRAAAPFLPSVGWPGAPTYPLGHLNSR
jgi:hypothetical protein